MLIGASEKMELSTIGAVISHVTVLREEQKSKQYSPKLITEDGILMDVREEHALKQYFPKLVTEDGILMDVREEHPEKQDPPKLVMLYTTPS